MADKKLIFFDIDGTLLDHDKKLPESSLHAVKKLKEDGHYVAIATGRAPFMYPQLREKLGINTFVSFNGQYVVLEGEPVVKNPLNRDELVRLTEKALENDHPVVYMDHEDMKANISYHPHIDTSIGSLKFDHPDYDPQYLQGRNIYQALLFCTAEEEDPYKNDFSSFDFIRWHEVSTDVLPAGGSKAKGIDVLMKRLNMKKEDVFVFGDGPNDLEMIQFTGNSVAMGNSVPEVKQAAGYVTKDVSDGGLVEGLKYMGLL